MNLSDLASISEIVSSIAIVATLVFLALQVKQNTTAIGATAMQAIAESEVSVLALLVNYPDIFTLVTKAELTDEDVNRLFAFLGLLLRTQENHWSQYQLGVIDLAALQRYEIPLITVLSFKRTRNWWHSRKTSYDPDFSVRINTLLKDAPIVEGTMSSRLRKTFEDVE